MTSDKGVILTIGLLVGTDRAALVMPVATDATPTAPEDLCDNAVNAFVQGDAMDALVALLTTHCYVSYVQAEGMDDGKIPSRNDFAATDHPGTVSGDTLPTQVGALVCFYEDPADIDAGGRMRHSRMTVPGCGVTQLTGGIAGTTLVVNLTAFAELLRHGFSAASATPPVFYRVLASPPRGAGGHAPATALKRIASSTIRRYLGTQRKRIVPHG